MTWWNQLPDLKRKVYRCKFTWKRPSQERGTEKTPHHVLSGKKDFKQFEDFLHQTLSSYHPLLRYKCITQAKASQPSFTWLLREILCTSELKQQANLQSRSWTKMETATSGITRSGFWGTCWMLRWGASYLLQRIMGRDLFCILQQHVSLDFTTVASET